MIPQTRWIGGSYEAACKGPVRVRTNTTIEDVALHLASRPRCTASEIATALGAPGMRITHALRRLEAKGLARAEKVVAFCIDRRCSVNRWRAVPARKKK